MGKNKKTKRPSNVEEDGKILIEVIKKEESSLSITDMVNKTILTRSAVRGAINYLKGSNKNFKERQVGMAKLYSLI